MGRLIIGEGFEVTITTTGSKMVVQDQDGGKLAISSSTMIFDSGSATETKMVNDGTKGIKLPTIAAIPTNTNRIGRRIEVYNLTTDQNLIIHPGGTKQRIIGLNVNTAMTLAGGGSCVFTVLSGSTYVGREAGAPS